MKCYCQVACVAIHGCNAQIVSCVWSKAKKAECRPCVLQVEKMFAMDYALGFCPSPFMHSSRGLSKHCFAEVKRWHHYNVNVIALAVACVFVFAFPPMVSK